MPNFTFTTALNGSPVKYPVDLGTASAGGGEASKDCFVSHDGVSPLLNCGFYVQPFAGTGYVGLYGESNDYLKVLDYGTNVGKGLKVNMFTPYTNPVNDVQFKVTQGEMASNAILMSTEAFVLTGGSPAIGTFPVSGTAKFRLKMAVPGSEMTVGKRQVSIFIKFDQ